MSPNLQYLATSPPAWVSGLFVATAALALLLLVHLLRPAGLPWHRTLLVAGAWLALQGGLAAMGAYQSVQHVPPRLLVLGIVPPLLLLLWLAFSRAGQHVIARLNPVVVVGLSVVRLPVELVLYYLFLSHLVPEMMTFAGRNFDVLAGISAPLVAYAMAQQRLSRKALLVWHVVALGLLLNIIATGLLSAPGPLQQLAFEQPNVALIQYPFVWLPTFVVPVVLFTHLAGLRQLFLVRTSNKNMISAIGRA